MSFLRQGEARTYYDGASESYIYPSTDQVQVQYGGINDKDFGELILRAVDRTELSDEAFNELIEAVTDYYGPEDEEDYGEIRSHADFVQEMYDQ